ncbi:hypothetical protein [Frankia gtarii]|uniref:hypothetical protein n=1 Tax=Frankia gtarii TaxID=2950102 RepID=UPI0021BE963F|nr:hypothetical protein [Frankia gtarii]
MLREWPYGDLALAYLSPADDDDFHLELLGGAVEYPREVLDDLEVSLRHGGYQHICPHVDSVVTRCSGWRDHGTDRGLPRQRKQTGRRGRGIVRAGAGTDAAHDFADPSTTVDSRIRRSQISSRSP